MNDRDWEEQSTERLREFLRLACGEEWIVTGRDVTVDSATGENFDFELACGKRKMALELFRIVESESELADGVAWTRYTGLLWAEMESRGLKDYTVEVPWVTKGSPQTQVKEAKLNVDKLEEKLRANPSRKEIKIGHSTFRRRDGLGTPHFWRTDFGVYDGTATAFRILDRILPKKNRQVSAPGHEGVLLVVHWLGLVSSDDFAAGCRRVDFRRFPNIARVYFEEGHGEIWPAFDRAAQ